MRNNRLIMPLILLILTLFLVSACSSDPTQDTRQEPEPTEAVSLDLTATPDQPEATDVNASTLPDPDATYTPTPLAPDFPLPIPQGEPGTEWRDVPIMEDAINGELAPNGTYAYLTPHTQDEVSEYYSAMMPANGWEFVISSHGQDGTLILIFENDTFSPKIVIFYYTEALSYVLLTP